MALHGPASRATSSVVHHRRRILASSTQTRRTTVVRSRERGRYDRETINAIVDEALICHVGFSVDGQPYVIPTIHVRIGDELYIHGSVGSRMLKNIRAGAPVCITI